MTKNNRRTRKTSYLYLAILVTIAAIICLTLSIYGIISADPISVSDQVSAFRDFAIFGGSLVLSAIVLWVLFIQS